MAFEVAMGNRRYALDRQGCPCGDGARVCGRLPVVSLMMQLSSLGDKVRRRAPAVTLHLCERCVRLIKTKEGRHVRKAFAAALQLQMVALKRQERAVGAGKRE
jgi:hypothetical protein